MCAPQEALRAHRFLAPNNYPAVTNQTTYPNGGQNFGTVGPNLACNLYWYLPVRPLARIQYSTDNRVKGIATTFVWRDHLPTCRHVVEGD